MKLSLLTLAISTAEAFLKCPRVTPMDCETCSKFNFKCKSMLGVRKKCAQYCRLEEMQCPFNSAQPDSCDACNDVSVPCQRRLGYRQQCRELCAPVPVACPMIIPGSCKDCRELPVPCRRSNPTCKELSK